MHVYIENTTDLRSSFLLAVDDVLVSSVPEVLTARHVACRPGLSMAPYNLRNINCCTQNEVIYIVSR